MSFLKLNMCVPTCTAFLLFDLPVSLCFCSTLIHKVLPGFPVLSQDLPVVRSSHSLKVVFEYNRVLNSGHPRLCLPSCSLLYKKVSGSDRRPSWWLGQSFLFSSHQWNRAILFLFKHKRNNRTKNNLFDLKVLLQIFLQIKSLQEREQNKEGINLPWPFRTRN